MIFLSEFLEYNPTALENQRACLCWEGHLVGMSEQTREGKGKLTQEKIPWAIRLSIKGDGWTGPSTGPNWKFKLWAFTWEFQSEKLNHHLLTAEQGIILWNAHLSAVPVPLWAVSLLSLLLLQPLWCRLYELKEKHSVNIRKNTSSVYSLYLCPGHPWAFTLSRVMGENPTPSPAQQLSLRHVGDKESWWEPWP